jgi:hypothetical protein
MAKAPKYEGINPLDRLHVGEPFFFIRAQDRLSVDAVVAYSHLLQKEANKAILRGDHILAESLQQDVNDVVYQAHRFMDWQEEHPDKVKLPD